MAWGLRRVPHRERTAIAGSARLPGGLRLRQPASAFGLMRTPRSAADGPLPARRAAPALAVGLHPALRIGAADFCMHLNSIRWFLLVPFVYARHRRGGNAQPTLLVIHSQSWWIRWKGGRVSAERGSAAGEASVGEGGARAGGVGGED